MEESKRLLSLEHLLFNVKDCSNMDKRVEHGEDKLIASDMVPSEDDCYYEYVILSDFEDDSLDSEANDKEVDPIDTMYGKHAQKKPNWQIFTSDEYLQYAEYKHESQEDNPSKKHIFNTKYSRSSSETLDVSKYNITDKFVTSSSEHFNEDGEHNEITPHIDGSYAGDVHIVDINTFGKKQLKTNYDITPQKSNSFANEITPRKDSCNADDVYMNTLGKKQLEIMPTPSSYKEECLTDGKRGKKMKLVDTYPCFHCGQKFNRYRIFIHQDTCHKRKVKKRKWRRGPCMIFDDAGESILDTSAVSDDNALTEIEEDHETLENKQNAPENLDLPPTLTTIGMFDVFEKTDKNNNISEKQLFQTDLNITDKQPMSFVCLMCGKKFQMKCLLLSHLRKSHMLTNLCQLCYFNRKKVTRFMNQMYLRSHKLEEHASEMVSCVYCKTLLCSERLLRIHLKRMKCDRKKRKEHFVKKKKIECICGEWFEVGSDFFRHKKNCQRLQDLLEAVRDHDDEESSGEQDLYPCKWCGRYFKRPYLYVHQKAKHMTQA